MIKSPEEFLKISNAYFHEGKFQEALNFCEKAIQLNPNCARAYHGKGVILTLQKRYDAARKSYDKAIELASSNARLLADMGDFYYSVGFIDGEKYNGYSPFSRSCKYYQRVIAIDSKFKCAYESKAKELVNEAEKLQSQGLANEAITAFQLAADFDPENEDVKQTLRKLQREVNQKNALIRSQEHPFTCKCHNCVFYG